ncbi:MAG: pitrilysin family protein [Pirellula sp.]
MQQKVFQHRLSNGMVVLGEPMPWLESVAFSLLIPAGTHNEPGNRLGIAGLVLEMCQRGAGPYSSRDIVEQLDFLGVERGSSVTTFHTSISMAAVANVLEPALEIASTIVRSPNFPKDELEDARQSALLELASIEDDPAQKCFKELKRLRYGEVFGRSSLGSESGIEETTLNDCKKFHRNFYNPDGAILSLAGNFDWNRFVELAEQLFGNWKGTPLTKHAKVVSIPGNIHLPHDSQQTHIAIAYDAVPYNHPDYYQGRGLVGILSDGMSSRLFAEVREKRGLVYSVSASSHSLDDCGSVMCYAGTTAPRAQETLQVTIDTIHSLAGGIELDELKRLKSRVRTSLIMEQESSSSRSSQMAYDWAYLGRVPTRQELLQAIEALTCESLLDHFQKNPPSRWSMVTIGPEPLEMMDAISK